MPLPTIEVGTTSCDVPLGPDTETLDPGPVATLLLQDVSHTEWETIQASTENQLEALGLVLSRMLTGVLEDGAEVPVWTRAECVEACTTWPYRQVHPIAQAVDVLHNGPDTDTPLDTSNLVAMATAAALQSMEAMSVSPTGQD